MPSAIARAVAPENLEDAIAALDQAVLDAPARKALLSRSFELPSGREKPGRFWKIDLEALDYTTLSVRPASAPRITATQVRGLTACDLAGAVRSHGELVSRAFESAAPAGNKFAALAGALCNTGAFVHVAADVAVDAPVEIVYDAQEPLFPYTVIVLERGASCTVIERFEGAEGVFVCGAAQLIAGENAFAAYAAEQQLPQGARAIFTRTFRPGRSANVVCSVADLGAELAVGTLNVAIEQPGVDAQVNALFFPCGNQHVDLISTVEHDVGDSQSQTLVKSAANGRGQARYLGNIRIAPGAQATLASLRDDALLLSRHAHIDSVPALEIAANDVKAYHGATVGALDAEQIFYMTSRGIAPGDAEKMIALGFFEPVIERFPTSALRERLRSALQAKVGE